MLYDPKALKAAATFASTDEYRPALRGVCIDAKKRLLASDGHKAIIVETTNPMKSEEYPAGHGLEPIEGQVIIPLEAIKQAVAFKVKSTLPILEKVLLGQNGKPTLYRTNLDQSQATPFRAIEGPFPNVDQVLPKSEPAFLVSVNAKLAASVFKALADMHLDTVNHGVTIEFRTELGAIIVRMEDQEHKVTALLMPIRLAK